MPRRKKETFYTKIAPHVIPFVVGFSLFLSLFLIALKIYSDNFEPVEREIVIASIEPTQNPEILARTVHWETYTDQDYPFSIKYPSNRLKNTSDAPLFAKAGVCTKKEVQTLTLEPVEFDTDSLPGEIYASLLQVTVHGETIPQETSITEWFQTNCQDTFDTQEAYKQAETTLYGKQVITLTDITQEQDDRYVTGKTQYFVVVDNTVFIITTHYSLETGADDEAIRHVEQTLADIVQTITFDES